MNNKHFFYRSIYNSLRFSFTRVSVIVISLFIGSMVSAAFLNISFDIETKLSHELKVYGANFIISPAHDKQNILQSDYEYAIEQIPKEQFKDSVPFLYGFFNLGSNSAIVAGVNLRSFKNIFPFIEVKDGYFGVNVFDEDSAFIGVSLAKVLEVKVGDKITLTNPNNHLSKEVTIQGIISSGDEFDGILLVPLEIVQNLITKDSTKPYIHFAKLILYGDFDSVSAIGKSLSNDFINAKPIAQVSLNEGVVLGKIKALMILICLVVLFITSLSVNTSLSSIIFSRKKEVALHLSLGASKKQIIKLFGSEVFVLALFSSILGAFCGYFLANLLGILIFNSSISFRLISVIIAVLITFVFAFLASFYPIKKALEINIITNLKGE